MQSSVFADLNDDNFYNNLDRYLPSNFLATGTKQTNIRTYYQPFLNSGNVFFNLLPVKAYLGNQHQELTKECQALRDTPKDVLDTLKFCYKNSSNKFINNIKETKYNSNLNVAGRCAETLFLKNVHSYYPSLKKRLAHTIRILRKPQYQLGFNLNKLLTAHKGDLIFIDMTQNNSDDLRYLVNYLGKSPAYVLVLIPADLLMTFNGNVFIHNYHRHNLGAYIVTTNYPIYS